MSYDYWKRPPTPFPWFEVFVFIVIFAACLGISAAYNQLVYGDWTCAFAHCRKVVQ